MKAFNLIQFNIETGYLLLQSDENNNSAIIAAHYYLNQQTQVLYDRAPAFSYDKHETKISGVIRSLKDINRLLLYIDYLKKDNPADPEGRINNLEKFAKLRRTKIEAQLEANRLRILELFSGCNPAPHRAPDWVSVQRTYITHQRRLDVLLAHPRIDEVFASGVLDMTRAEFDTQINKWRDSRTRQLLNDPIYFDLNDGREAFIMEYDTYVAMARETEIILKSLKMHSIKPLLKDELMSAQEVRMQISSFLSRVEEAIEALPPLQETQAPSFSYQL